MDCPWVDPRTNLPHHMAPLAAQVFGGGGGYFQMRDGIRLEGQAHLLTKYPATPANHKKLPILAPSRTLSELQRLNSKKKTTTEQ